MIDYQTLKKRYIATIQFGLLVNAKYGPEPAKRANDTLHKFCEDCVDNSSYSELDKQNMKRELEAVKEALSQEIDQYFHVWQ